ncbi:nitroreductase [Chloroflexota bacterium]
MDVLEAIRLRKSIRGYKLTPVTKEVIQDILDASCRAPSASNSQPWEFTIVTGETLDNIKQGNLDMFDSGASQNPDISEEYYTGEYKRRSVDLAIRIFRLMGMERDNKEKRVEWMQKGLRFYDAPVVILLFMDRSFSVARLFDIGIISQTICLLALNYGLATCIHAQGILYPDVVRKFIKIPDSKMIVMCITVGYPDWDFPANKLETPREPVENIVNWYGFD